MDESHPILKDLQDYKDLLLKSRNVTIGASMDPQMMLSRAGWRRYGTKQRPVRANKRRRLAKRYPLGKKCAARQREKLARQKRTDYPYQFGRYSPAILATF